MLWWMLVPFVGLFCGDGVQCVSQLVAEYTKRVCKNEPTCSYVNHPNIPKTLRSLEKRNCLCDSDCKEYQDCCIDSMFYRIHDQLPPFSYYCSPNKKVYMKTRCLAEWTDPNMISKCQKSILPLEDDLSVITPLTNYISGITYGNVYCAVCNNAFTADNMQDFYTWTLTTRCGELPYTLLPPLRPQPSSQPSFRTPFMMPTAVPHIVPLDPNFEMTLKQLYPSLRNVNFPKSGYYLLVLLLYYIHPPTATIRMVRSVQPPIQVVSDKEQTVKNVSYFEWNARNKRKANLEVDFDRYIDEWEMIALNASYDSDTKLWLSHYKDKHFVCEYESKLPASADVPLRTCIPNVIAECSKFDNEVHVHECRLRMEVVYDKRGYAFRNKECALCNAAREEDVFVCPYEENAKTNYLNNAPET